MTNDPEAVIAMNGMRFIATFLNVHVRGSGHKSRIWSGAPGWLDMRQYGFEAFLLLLSSIHKVYTPQLPKWWFGRQSRPWRDIRVEYEPLTGLAARLNRSRIRQNSKWWENRSNAMAKDGHRRSFLAQKHFCMCWAG